MDYGCNDKTCGKCFPELVPRWREVTDAEFNVALERCRAQKFIYNGMVGIELRKMLGNVRHELGVGFLVEIPSGDGNDG